MGLLGMPRKAPVKLPTADPDHDGEVTAANVMPVGEVALKLNENIEPSVRVIENGWPPPKTDALL